MSTIVSETEINHPKHYTSHNSGVECIEITEHMYFNIGNAFKYIYRGWNGLKESTSKDLKKSIWYLKREIESDKDHILKSHEIKIINKKIDLVIDSETDETLKKIFKLFKNHNNKNSMKEIIKLIQSKLDQNNN
jgi:hypothetical protein